MTEGLYKTNVKPTYFECGSCGYRAPDYMFSHGLFWWKKIHCPICESVVVEVAVRKRTPLPAPQKPKFNVDDKRRLRFLYNRLLNHHLENANYDYMIHFKNIIDRI